MKSWDQENVINVFLFHFTVVSLINWIQTNILIHGEPLYLITIEINEIILFKCCSSDLTKNWKFLFFIKWIILVWNTWSVLKIYCSWLFLSSFSLITYYQWRFCRNDVTINVSFYSYPLLVLNIFAPCGGLVCCCCCWGGGE